MFYMVGNATIYFSFEAAGQSVEVTLPNKVWGQPIYPENIPAEYMSKLKGGTVIGIKLTAPEEYGYDVTVGYNKLTSGVVGTGQIRSGEYRPVGMPQPTPAPVQSTIRIYPGSPSVTAIPKDTPAASPTPALTKTPSPTTPAPTTQPAKGLPDLIISDVWLAAQGRTGFNTPCGKPSKNTDGKFVRIPDSTLDGNSYEEFQISYTVKNIGTGPVPTGYAGLLNITTSIWIDGVYKGQSAAYVPDGKTALDPGQTTTNTVSFALRFWDFSAGAHTVTLRTNTEIATDGSIRHLVDESNYENNQVVLTTTARGCQK